MQQLRLSPDGVRFLSRRTFRISLISMVSGILAYVGFMYYKIGGQVQDDPTFWFIPGGMVVVFLGLFFLRRQRSRKILEGLTYYYDDNSITRHLSTVPDLTIHFLEISNVVKRKKGDLLLYGLTKQDVIWIPKELEQFDVIEARLQEYLPDAGRQPLSWKRYLPVVAMLVVMISAFVVLGVEDKVVTACAAVLFVIGLPFMVIQTHRSKFARPRTKYFMYLFWAFVLLDIFLKLTGINVINQLGQLLASH